MAVVWFDNSLNIYFEINPLWLFSLIHSSEYRSRLSLVDKLGWGTRCNFFSLYTKWTKNKHLMTGPKGNSEFCFPETPMFPDTEPRVTLRVEGKQNSLFLKGPVIKVCCYTSQLKIEQCTDVNLPLTCKISWARSWGLFCKVLGSFCPNFALWRSLSTFSRHCGLPC